ncbi:MAG: DUF4347 domain-containing protein [Acidovorax sp.]|nr:DUF4347 domain-containing protein [Acidovorax sp.]MCZ8221800.1 DUF4347 domain-containing protein [Acidovorax sp.]
MNLPPLPNGEPLQFFTSHTESSQPPTDTLAQGLRTGLIFIDGQLEGIDQLVQNLPAGFEVIVLDGSKNGIAQMAEYVAGRHGIDSIALISHGSPGAIQAGSVWLSAQNMRDHQSDLTRIGQSLAADGDLMFYGCKVADGEEGQELLETIAAITGADVAGSSDNTGTPLLGGDWVLERSVGHIETAALYGQAFSGYGGLLAGPTSQIFDTVILDGSGYSYVPVGQSSTFEGWTFSVLDRTGSIDAAGQMAYTNDASTTGLANNNSDKALVFQGAVENLTGQAAASLKSATTDKFRFVSITVESFQSNGDDYVLVGYLNGVEVSGARQTFTAGQNLSGGTIVSVSGNAWDNLDEIRIMRGNGQTDISLSVDDLLIAAPIAPSAAPVITNINGDSATYVEKGPVIILDAGVNAVVTDTDSANFAGGLLSVNIITNRSTIYDALVVVNQGTGAGQIGVSGSNVTFGGVTFGAFTGGTGNNSLDFSLNSNATPAAVQALIRTIGFNNSDLSDPVTATRTISWSLTDGGGGTSATYTSQLQFNAVNDAPTLTGTGRSPTFTEGGSRADLFNFSAVSTVEQLQRFTSFGVQMSGVSDGSSESLSIDGSIIALYNGNVVGATANNGLQVSVSVSGGVANVTVTSGALLTNAATLSILNGISYSNSSDNPTAGNRVASISFLRDNGGTANGGADTAFGLQSSTVTVAPLNDAPVLTTSGGSTAFTAGDNASAIPVVVDSAITLSDLDSTTAASASVAITGNFHSGEDQLIFINNNSSLYGNITASYNAGTGVLSLSSAGASATLSQWQAALRSVSYTDTAVTPNSSTRTISFTINDGTTNSTTQTRTVTVTPVDQTPLLSNSGGSGAFTEGLGYVPIDPGVSVSDLDNSTLSSGTVQISGNFRSGEDLLLFTNTSSTTFGNIVGSYNAGTGALTLSSAGSVATVAQWQAALRAASYTNTSESPDTSTRTISFTVSDGTKSSAAGDKTLTLIAVNDIPTVANPISDQIAPEDAALAFQIPANAFADVDTGDTLTYSAQLSGGGALPAWLSFDPATRTFSGTPANGDVGVLSIDVTVNDGNGGSATDTFQITVSNTNDAPTVANAIPNRSGTEGLAFSYTLAANTFTDVDVGDVLTYSAQLAGGGALPTWLSFDPATLTFSGTPTAASTITVEVIANDGNGGSVSDSFDVVITAVPVDPEPPVTPPVTPPGTPPAPGVPDNDGIPAAVEDQVPGIPGPGGTVVAGDGNGDGIKDSEQAGVASIGFVLSPTGESNPGNAPPTFTTLVASSQDGKVGSGNDNARITSLTQKDAPTDLPAGMQMPIGLVSFTVELGQGKTGENFSLYVDPALGVNGYWKENASGQWVNIASEPYGGKMVMEGGRLRLDFHIEDGGQFDADGKADGIITDPGAPGHMALSVVGMAPDMPHGFWF